MWELRISIPKSCSTKNWTRLKTFFLNFGFLKMRAARAAHSWRNSSLFYYFYSHFKISTKTHPSSLEAENEKCKTSKVPWPLPGCMHQISRKYMLIFSKWNFELAIYITQTIQSGRTCSFVKGKQFVRNVPCIVCMVETCDILWYIDGHWVQRASDERDALFSAAALVTI
jgi:hypothetical protein